MEATTKATTTPETGHAPTGANGQATPAEGTFDVVNPATGAVIETLETAGHDEVEATVARVRAAQPEWEALGNKGRAKWLYKLRDWMLDNYDPIADTMQEETGKVRADATGEAVYLTDAINFYGKKAEKFLRDDKVRPHNPLLSVKKLRVAFRPYPVVGIISPWNFPLILSLGDAIPALQAGCAVVIKPSEFTPLGLRDVVKAWKEEVGGPDVLDVVLGKGETGAELVEHVDYMQFTGSDRTGRKVAARAAERLIPVSLELGGKDPMVVMDNADLDRAANAATWGGMMNSGQICMSTERIYVEEPVYDEFVQKLESSVKELRQGADGPEFSEDVGAMTSPNQTEIVEDHVKDALANGAKALTGAKRKDGPGDYYEPTILVDVDHSMKVMRDETFGPVVGVMKVRDTEEAVRLANDTRYGLSGAVFGPKREAEKVARRIEAGAVNVNDVLVNYLASDVPMGGWKTSGIGYRHGIYGIRKYCRMESLVITRFGGKRELLWYPYTPKRRGLLRRLANFINGRGGRRFGS